MDQQITTNVMLDGEFLLQCNDPLSHIGSEIDHMWAEIAGDPCFDIRPGHRYEIRLQIIEEETEHDHRID